MVVWFLILIKDKTNEKSNSKTDSKIDSYIDINIDNTVNANISNVTGEIVDPILQIAKEHKEKVDRLLITPAVDLIHDTYQSGHTREAKDTVRKIIEELLDEHTDAVQS